MRFVSKNSNLRVVLEPGLSAQPLSGFQGKNPVYIKFENGVVEISDENLIQKMLQHPAYTRDGDFIAVGADGIDPFADRREEMEPVHLHTELKYGHVEGSSMSPLRKTKVNPELKKLVNDLATKQMQDMLPGLIAQGVKDVIATMAAQQPEGLQQAPKTAPVVEDEDEEEDFSNLTPEDFLEIEDIEDQITPANTDLEDDSMSTKISELSPEAAAAASSIIGNKKKTPAPKGK